jgi:hypothetical protein
MADNKKSLDLRNRVKNEKIEAATISSITKSIKIMYNASTITKFESAIGRDNSLTITILELPTR